MFKMRFGTALAFLAVVVSPLLLECAPTCKMGNPADYVEGQCPVKLTPVPAQSTGGSYFEHVTVRVWMKADDFCKSPKIEILSKYKEILRPTLKKKKSKTKCEPNNGRYQSKSRVRCQGVQSVQLWELAHDGVEAEAGSDVVVSYSTDSTSCSVTYTAEDPEPDFDLSVNLSSKSITVTVEPGHEVHARWCYQKNAANCIGGSDSPQINIDPSQSRSALLNLSYLLPCVCVEVYYTYTDAKRRKKCPFQSKGLVDVSDVWRSSEVVLYDSKLTWSSECPASDLNVSASLCWMQREHLCTPVLNSTLEKEDGPSLVYNTSGVDKHPQMCVQFSLKGSHNISCPFDADMSSWEVYIGPGRQSILVYLTSSAPAEFSTQLCVLSERGCAPLGSTRSVAMEGNSIETRINVPSHFLTQKLCVQVWQSDPALHGRRILCPDYGHKRRGMYAAAALIFVVAVALLGVFIHRITKTGAAGWLHIQKPLLLVCSSDESAHISAACALASILQGELGATVHTALWAQTSQKQAETGAGVADLGPLPWLYGQWEAVCKAQGKMLIIWSPEAKKTYEKWGEERAEEDVRHGKTRVEVEEDSKVTGRRLGKCKKEKAAVKKDCVKLCDDKDWSTQKEPSTVIQPVFTAALACLEGALQECKGQGVAIVYFQGLGHSRDIPKAFRGVPRYCLPQDFRRLIQELGEMRRLTKAGKFRWHCWPRLMSKVLSIWLARQLAQRLQTLLPQMQEHKTHAQSVTSSLKMTDKTQSRLKLPLAAWPGDVQEQELLRGSPQRAEKL